MRNLSLFRAVVGSGLCAAAALCIDCVRDTTPDFSFNTQPPLPPVEPLEVYDGYGTYAINLNMFRSQIEDSLGPPVDSIDDFYIYRKEDVEYAIEYVAYQADYLVMQMEFWSDRFITVSLIDTQYYYGISYRATQDEMEDFYGTPRASDYHWYYDLQGVGFIYDPDMQRIVAVVVYPPRRYSIAAWISDSVDNDDDGYLASYHINFDVNIYDIFDLSDSVIVDFWYRDTGEEEYQYLAPYPELLHIRGFGSNDAAFVPIGGSDHWTIQWLINVSTYSGYSVTGLVFEINEEDSLNDTTAAAKMRYPPAPPAVKTVSIFTSQTQEPPPLSCRIPSTKFFIDRYSRR